MPGPGLGGGAGGEEDPQAILEALEEELGDLGEFGIGFLDGIENDVNQGLEEAGEASEASLTGLEEELGQGFEEIGGIGEIEIGSVDHEVGSYLQDLDLGNMFEAWHNELIQEWVNPEPFLEQVDQDSQLEFFDGIGDALSALIRLIEKIAEFLSGDWLDKEDLEALATKVARWIIIANRKAVEAAEEEAGGGSSGGSGGGGGGYAWPQTPGGGWSKP